MRRAIFAALVAATLACARAPATGASAAPPEARFPPDQAPPSLAPAVARCEAAIRDMREALARRFAEELAASGPAGALRVCGAEAPAVAQEVMAEHDVEIGRSTLMLRNPSNAPRPWVKVLLADAQGRRAAEVQAVAVDLGNRVGVVRPIAVSSVCLACHGAPETFSPAVQAAIAAAYPDDAATGYVVGDFRGFFWAEAKK